MNVSNPLDCDTESFDHATAKRAYSYISVLKGPEKLGQMERLHSRMRDLELRASRDWTVSRDCVLGLRELLPLVNGTLNRLRAQRRKQ